MPIDNGIANPLEIGVGYDYSWTLMQQMERGWTMLMILVIAALFLQDLMSVQPFSNLNGCPLNGTWEIEICDIFSIDDGYLFDWGISFDDFLSI